MKVLPTPGLAHAARRTRPSDEVLLRWVHDYIEFEWVAPSVRDIAEHFDVAINTAQVHLTRLVEEGLLERKPGVARAMRLTRAGENMIGVQDV